jgi:hypothetical protein
VLSALGWVYLLSLFPLQGQRPMRRRWTQGFVPARASQPVPAPKRPSHTASAGVAGAKMMAALWQNAAGARPVQSCRPGWTSWTFRNCRKPGSV